ncbi:TetR/AcrR family transcriptional regulator [Amycolatopsis australiensis]|uniref:DNA-binding transcriptional regulator, AcrR family n=1 Tax=Amycolatopsis australiensis TaxID=546364 RepID=A0A1K1T6N9_9PSEU|nr:TetR family transcriptional regulator [Amycolatopsis australiensis]SFW92234.1 DNA-binding transcriptional regulator, AcrR family [Amycolatopsis australiensis]
MRDAEDTKRRLLAAATEEFAERGIAGARVDRIADAAGCNKAMLYKYFHSKDALFDTVFGESVGRFVIDIPVDAADLPGYAGKLFDRYESQPHTLRLAIWHRLERPEGKWLTEIVLANEIRLAELQRAQDEGKLSKHYTPLELLVLIQSITTAWATTNTELGVRMTVPREQRRALVVDAVRRLIAED